MPIPAVARDVTWRMRHAARWGLSTRAPAAQAVRRAKLRSGFVPTIHRSASSTVCRVPSRNDSNPNPAISSYGAATGSLPITSRSSWTTTSWASRKSFAASISWTRPAGRSGCSGYSGFQRRITSTFPSRPILTARNSVNLPGRARFRSAGRQRLSSRFWVRWVSGRRTAWATPRWRKYGHGPSHTGTSRRSPARRGFRWTATLWLRAKMGYCSRRM